MEQYFKEWPYTCKNPTLEWNESTNLYKIRKLVENLDNDSKSLQVFRSAKIFFNGCCDEMAKNWSHAKEEERLEREKSQAQVFSFLIDLTRSDHVKSNESINAFLDVFIFASKQKKFNLFKVLCIVRLLTILNNGDFWAKFSVANTSELFSALEINLNFNESYLSPVIRPLSQELDKLVFKYKKEEFVKNVATLQKYFE